MGVLVVGMHRSGTSALAGALSAIGLTVGDQHPFDALTAKLERGGQPGGPGAHHEHVDGHGRGLPVPVAASLANRTPQ